LSTDTNGQQMHGPKFKWEWSLNTIVILAGFAAMLVAWGFGLSEFTNGRAQDAKSIVEIRAEIKRIDETDRTLDSHEIRLTAVERRQGETMTDMRGLETAISQLSSDMRLTREILERLEKSMTNVAGR
jgi:hypothetical protein